MVGPNYLNERKWDEGRGVKTAVMSGKIAALSGRYHEFDAEPPPASQPHWHEYDASADPHARAYLRRRKQQQAAAGEPSGLGDGARADTADDSMWLLPGPRRIKGVPEELGRRLQLAKEAHRQRASR